MAGFSWIVIASLAFSGLFNQSSGFVRAVKQKNQIEVRALYMSAYTAGSAKKRAGIVQLIKKSNLNSVVIDVKDSTGKVFFESNVPLAKDIGSEHANIAPDLPKFLQELKKNNIYAIARIAVFEDPYLAERAPSISLKTKDGKIWRDKKGLAWVDPSSPVVWKYVADIGRSALLLGFDELNFDYIRFPTDGNIENISYPVFQEKTEKKNEIIAEFFYFINKSFKNYPAYISVDLFGITLWRSDGINIGQRYQDAAEYVDYISPMVYPSHYPDGFEGYANPADFPYEIVFKSLEKSRTFMKNKHAKMRPWLQDFDLGAVYDKEKVQAQIKAAKDSGSSGYMFWNASNRYTEDAF